MTNKGLRNDSQPFFHFIAKGWGFDQAPATASAMLINNLNLNCCSIFSTNDGNHMELLPFLQSLFLIPSGKGSWGDQSLGFSIAFYRTILVG